MFFPVPLCFVVLPVNVPGFCHCAVNFTQCVEEEEEEERDGAQGSKEDRSKKEEGRKEGRREEGRN